MLPDRACLLARISPSPTSAGVIAAFIGAGAVGIRRPAVREFPSRADASQWIECEAGAVGLPVEWIDRCFERA